MVPFAISFGILPSLATLAAPVPVVAPWWQSVAGALLGIAVHLTNVLPDLEDDEATGVRGLGHRLGATPSAIVAFVAVIAGTVVVVIGSAGTTPVVVPDVASGTHRVRVERDGYQAWVTTVKPRPCPLVQ